MAMTVFGDLSDHSSLVSEGSAIAEIEKELQQVVATGGRQGKASDSSTRASGPSLTTFTSPPLHLNPTDSDGDTSEETTPQSSPGYIPTALEQR